MIKSYKRERMIHMKNENEEYVLSNLFVWKIPGVCLCLLILHYYITIFYDGNLNTINLSEYKRNLFTFGKDPENDIVIESEEIDDEQGYFEITEHGVLAVNTSKNFPMIGNNDKAFDDIYLSEGSFIKIINPNTEDRTHSILFMMSIGSNLDEWKGYQIQIGATSLGRMWFSITT